MSIVHADLVADLGKLFGALEELNTFRGTTLVAREATIRTEFSTDPYLILTELRPVRTGAEAVLDTYAEDIATLVNNTIIGYVNADRDPPYTAIEDAFPEWIRQLNNDGDTFNDSPVTMSLSPGPGSAPTPTADYVFHYTSMDRDGKASDVAIPDRLLITVAADADHGGTRWGETLAVVSKEAPRNVLDSSYITGAGIQTTITVLDPAITGGLVSDGGFDNYAAGAFTSWTRFTLLTSADVDQFADDLRDGANGFCARFIADGVTVTGVKQTIVPTAETVLAVHFAVKGTNAALGTAKVHVSLRNATTNVIIQDEQGVNLQKSSDTMTALVGTGLWTHYTAQWAMPKRLPAGGVYLDIRLADGTTVSTPATIATSARIDHVTINQFTELTSRGAKLLVYSGAVEPIPSDQWELTISLASGAITDYFVRWLDRTVGLATRDYKAPTVAGGTETLLDSVIS